MSVKGTIVGCLVFISIIAILCAAAIFDSRRFERSHVWASDVYAQTIPTARPFAVVQIHIIDTRGCAPIIARQRPTSPTGRPGEWKYSNDCSKAEVILDAEYDICLRHGEMRLLRPATWKGQGKP